MSSDAWDFGWEAVAALGGAVAALGTLLALFFLYKSTKAANAAAKAAQLSAEAAQSEVTAAWRPILVPTGAEAMWSPSGDNFVLTVGLRNIGAGPALGLRAALYRDVTEISGRPTASNELEMSTAVMNARVVLAGAESHCDLDAKGPPDGGRFKAHLFLIYRDLSRREHMASASVTTTRPPPSGIVVGGQERSRAVITDVVVADPGDRDPMATVSQRT